MADGRFNASLTVTGQVILDAMRESTSALILAVILSDDGFEVVRTPRGSESDGKFASMASSVQALSEAVVHELQIGTGDAMIIKASAGVVIQMRVAGQPLVISALFKTDESLGKCLVVLRQATEKLEMGFHVGGLTLAGPDGAGVIG